jgi:tRNA A-37 threonylcarbamoyl transferase component Bud32
MAPPGQHFARDNVGCRGMPPGGVRFWVAPEFREALAQQGLISLETVFACEVGRDLAKPNIGRFRRRLQLEVQPRGATRPVRVFLKRYDRPPRLGQLRNWLLHHQRRSFARTEGETIERLAASGIPTPHIVAFGEQWGLLCERRSFLMTEEIPDSESLERRLPPCFDDAAVQAGRAVRRDFIRRLGAFIRRFHDTGFRHRDLYLSHIFCSRAGTFSLIDLARASRPLRQRRFQVKDIAQLHFSAPAPRFSRTDRLRFYLAYAGRRRLLPQDKVFLGQVARKAGRMARHSAKHGARIPFLRS